MSSDLVKVCPDSKVQRKIFLVPEKNLIELKSISDIELDEQTGYMVEDNFKEWKELTPALEEKIIKDFEKKYPFLTHRTDVSFVKFIFQKLKEELK